MAWTEPMVERVGALWKDGVSAREIARTLASEFVVWPTRNAVIGVIHRKKFVRAGAPSGEKEKKREHQWPAAYRRFTKQAAEPNGRGKNPAKSGKIRRLINRGHTFEVALTAAPDPLQLTPTDDLLIPMAQRCGILDLTLSTCRWPIGDPQDETFFYCGAPVARHPGSSLGDVYCDAHCRRAWAVRSR